MHPKKMMIPQQIQQIKQIISKPTSIVLVGHKNPDGDAVGACLAMQHYLSLKGHQVQSIVPNAIPDFLKWMPLVETIYKYDNQRAVSNKILSKAQWIFLLDFNALHRVGEDLQKQLEKQRKEFFLMIDHHQQPEEVAFYTYSDPKSCATCQMVYDFIVMMGDEHLINPTIATCLYTGIMTDTGSFKFSLTTSYTHRTVANLIDKGAINHKIQEAIFNNYSYAKLQILGLALNNIKILKEFYTAYIVLSAAQMEPIEYKKGDTEGLVNYGLSLKNIYLAAIFIEDLEQNIIKISFRSRGNFSVNTFARNHFNGGGHNNAAGGSSKETLLQTVQTFEGLLPQYKEILKKSYEN